ncbi:MAG TPA: alpha/beta hydrolase, partial [Opitutus sp.]|nr:alpha/beta hydrolase [Opitutus sp.]
PHLRFSPTHPMPATAAYPPQDRPRPKWPRRMRWFKRVAPGFAAVFVVAVVTAAIVQARHDRSVAAEYPAPGQLVDIGGCRLHVIERGSGPAVVFEAGAGCCALDWDAVQTPLASVARTIAYDRAGNAWSDPAPAPRTPPQITDELHTLLHRLGVPPPYVLVGHSLGGIYVQVFARRFPDEVAGLVLVDSSHPEQGKRMGGFAPDLTPLMIALAPLGVQRLFLRGGAPAIYRPDVWKARQAVLGRTESVRAAAREVHAIMGAPADGSQLRPLPRPIPIIVLTHSQPLLGLPAEKAARFEATWRTLQRELALLSPRGVQRVVPNSSHMIPFGQPAAIVDAVKEILGTLPPPRPSARN